MKVRVPATSANLAVGFDCLGVAFDLYNEFIFERNEEFYHIGFDCSLEDNLVYQSYLKFFEAFNLNPIPVLIKQGRHEVPSSRGLGSSATCIVAGIVAANNISGTKVSDSELLELMVQLEGHPDNVYPAFLGGMISTFYDDGYQTTRIRVNDVYKFYVVISDHIASTEMLREALPSNISIADAVFNISRAIQLVGAFYDKDFDLLKKVLKDRLHQSYRAAYIPHFDEVKSIVEKNSDLLVVSGSGSTLLIISDKEVSYQFKNLEVVEVKVSEGVTICE